jgi:hypothetical protein
LGLSILISRRILTCLNSPSVRPTETIGVSDHRLHRASANKEARVRSRCAAIVTITRLAQKSLLLWVHSLLCCKNSLIHAQGIQLKSPEIIEYLESPRPEKRLKWIDSLFFSLLAGNLAVETGS